MIVVDGVPGAEISAADRGLAYGDGVFRTLPAFHGRPMHWRRQYSKLSRDCSALSITPPNREALESEIGIACAGMRLAAVKIIVTRGAGGRGYRPGSGVATRVVMASPPPDYPVEFTQSGVAARRCTLVLAHQPALAGIKHLNRLENVLARAEWQEPEIAEGILCDGAGNVVGGTMTNIFAVVAGRLVTPALERCGVAGVTRERVIEGAARRALACESRELSWSELMQADEVFLTNSLAGIWPVRELAGTPLTPGPVTRAIQSALQQEDREDHAQVA